MARRVAPVAAAALVTGGGLIAAGGALRAVSPHPPGDPGERSDRGPPFPEPVHRDPVLYLDGPPTGHTGGFDEPTCVACHFDAPLNVPPGSVTLSGMPATYVAGGTYSVEVVLHHPRSRRGGFQLSVRFAAGSRAGDQAGTLRSPGRGHVQVVRDTTTGVLYAAHTEEGTEMVDAARDGSFRWTVFWDAPAEPNGDAASRPVVLHVAANAANDDASEFGDRVYTDSATVPPRLTHR